MQNCGLLSLLGAFFYNMPDVHPFTFIWKFPSPSLLGPESFIENLNHKLKWFHNNYVNHNIVLGEDWKGEKVPLEGLRFSNNNPQSNDSNPNTKQW